MGVDAALGQRLEIGRANYGSVTRGASARVGRLACNFPGAAQHPRDRDARRPGSGSIAHHAMLARGVFALSAFEAGFVSSAHGRSRNRRSIVLPRPFSGNGLCLPIGGNVRRLTNSVRGHIRFVVLAITAAVVVLCFKGLRKRGTQTALRHCPRIDVPTGLLNQRVRKHFGPMPRSRHIGCRGSVEFAGVAHRIDGFKSVNDRFGPSAKDELFRQATRRLSAALRDSDSLLE